MFDVGASELLLIAIIAIVVIGPKDMPLALRTAGKWIGKMRAMSRHFHAGLDTMIREAEMEEMERKWKEENERIMAQDAIDQRDPAHQLANHPHIEGEPPVEDSAMAATPAPAAPASTQPNLSTSPELPLEPKSS